MSYNPQKVIDVAEKEVGYKEKATNSQLDEPNANVGTNNWTKYARDIDEKYPNFYNGKKNGYDWCDVFVDWCFIKAYGVESAKKLLYQPDKSLGAGCEYSYRYFRDAKQVGNVPKLGAQIFFGDLDHTGLVVGYDDTYVYTIEGNTGVDTNEVKRKQYKKDSSWIYGYGYPDFGEVEPVPSGNKWKGEFPKLPSRGYYLKGDGYEKYTNLQSQIKLIQAFLNWAINAGLEEDGFYGEKTEAKVKEFQKAVGIKVDGSYGKETLEAAKSFEKKDDPKPEPQPVPTPSKKVVKASQPAASYSKKYEGTYRVISKSGLNLRDGASTKYKVLAILPYGCTVNNYGFYTEDDGLRWLYVQVVLDGTEYIGFVSAQWLS